MENRFLDKNGYIGKYKSYGLKNIKFRTRSLFNFYLKKMISSFSTNNKRNEVNEELKKFKITTTLFDLDLNNINCKPAVNDNFIIVHFFQISRTKLWSNHLIENLKREESQLDDTNSHIS